MKKIIHLSDLHVGHYECGANFWTIVQKITSLKQPAKNFIIIITGDIVDNANHDEQIDEAVEIIEILEEHGCRVLVIPGNHDYGNGAQGNKKFVDLFKERYYKTKHVTYPKLDIIGKTAFIGLDSTAEELHWHDRFFSEGELGKKQLSALKKMLKDPRVAKRKKVVYLHHHPFDFKLAMHLKDSSELKKIISNKIDAILFGHYHRDPEVAGKDTNGRWGIPRCYNAGSSTHKNGDLGSQRIIDLSKDDPAKDRDGKFI
jgi:3',5'-cyclic AMP phosphodiesterase CpdA